MAHATTRIDTALARVVSQNFDRLVAVWPEAMRAEPEAVRQARIASRRLREAIALARAVAPRVVRKRAARDLARIGRVLGRAREMAVARQDLESSAAAHGWTEDQLKGVRARVARELVVAERRVRRRLASCDLDALRRRLAGLEASSRASGAAGDWHGHLAAAVARRASRVAEARARVGTLYEPERLHALRIALKKLRYTVELLGALTGVPVKSLLTVLKTQQQQYGRLDDRQVLLDEVRHAEAIASRRSSRRLDAVIETLEGECRRGHAELVSTLDAIDESVSAARCAAASLTQNGRQPMAMPLVSQIHLAAAQPRRQVG